MILKKQLFHIHSFTGVFLGVFLFLISFSGTILVFKPELEKSFFAEEIYTKKSGQKKALNEITKAINLHYTDYLIGRFYMTKSANELYQALLVSRKDINEHIHISINPYTLEIQKRSDNWLTFLTDFHHELLLPHYIGNIILFVISLLYLVLSLTGILIKKDFFQQFIRFKNRKNVAGNIRELHVLMAYWSLFFHLIMISTSIVITLATVLYGPLTDSFLQKIPKKMVNYEKIEKIIQDKYQLPIKHIQLAPNAIAVSVYANPERNNEFYQSIKVGLDTNYQIISEKGVDRESYIMQGLNACTSFHFGRFGGIFIKSVYCFFGFLLSMISLSGTIMFFSRNKGTVKLSRKTHEFSFKKCLKKGFYVSILLILSSCLIGLVLGVFGNELVRSMLYLGIHIAFLFIVLTILVALFFPFKWIITKVIKRRFFIYFEVLSLSLGAMIPSILFLIIIGFLM